MPTAIPLDTVGGLVCCVRPEEMPEGASPRNWDIDYAVGRWYQRPGLRSVYSYAGSFVAGAAASAVNVPITGNAWANPGAVLAADQSYALCGGGAGNTLVGGSDGLDVTQLSLSVPATNAITGLQLDVNGFGTGVTMLSAQLLVAGVPAGEVKTVQLPAGANTITLGGPADPWGLALAYADVNATMFGFRLTASSEFGLASAYVDFAELQIAVGTGAANFNYMKTFTARDGSVKNLMLDANGNLWVEDVTADPGVLTLVLEGLTQGSFASSVTADDGEFLAFSGLTGLVTGSDLPRKYLPGWQDRVAQVGPGAAPVFTASSASTTTYAIEEITQPAAQTRGYSYFLQSTGPGSNQAGNVCTVYYSDSTGAGPDQDLVTAFNSGQPVYLRFSFTGTPVVQGPTTVLVTSVGLAAPPGQPRQFYYFTFATSTLAYTYYAGSGHGGYAANYQRTLATMTTAVPVPQLEVGSSAVITGNSVAAYNATWPITQTLNSGAMSITQSSLTAGVATFSYAVVSGANPVAGQLVTITGTLNANGQLNVVNTAIASVNGGALGTFTVAGYSARADYPAQAESGQATTAGTQFAFDPGAATLGTATNPIYGTGTGGEIVVTGVGQYIGAGTRQGVYGWITRNGFLSPPSPPCTFDVPENTTELLGSQFAIGPPNVVGRWVAFTEGGANGVPGANFFRLPVPVQFIVQGVTHTATATQINDNTSTTAQFMFPDAELLAATAVDVQGNDLFNLIEPGDPAWVLSYASRNIYGLCRNKAQNFLNLTFDGGYLPGGQLTPLGWTAPDAYGSLLVSPVFGNSYYIANTTGGALAQAGLIAQSAYQDAYLVPIVQPNVAYSVRIAARVPSGKPAGTLQVQLAAAGIVYGVCEVPFADMDSTMAVYEGDLLANAFASVPAALMLELLAVNLGAGADVEVDRVEIYPTSQPVLETTPLVSYANNRESIDANTGAIDTSEENAQPCYGGAVVLDQLFLLKERSMLSVQDASNEEPANWGTHEISNTVGTCGPNAFDYGDEWLLTMLESGVYGFNGGRPEPISRELQLQNGPTASQQRGLWESIDWRAAKTFWLKNDIDNRRFYCGVALPTPNFWLPSAPAAQPTQPNVILMCNYEGCPTFDDLIQAAPVHTTIQGTLKALEQRRKWSIWQIAAPYMAQVKRSTGAQLTMLLGNGIASGKIYELVQRQPDDDGAPVYPLYTTYGFDGMKQSAVGSMPFGLKTMTYWTGNVQGMGLGGLRVYANTLEATRPKVNPLALRLQAVPQANDERRFEISGQRLYVEISGLGDGKGGAGYMECGQMAVDLQPAPWGAKRGIAL